MPTQKRQTGMSLALDGSAFDLFVDFNTITWFQYTSEQFMNFNTITLFQYTIAQEKIEINVRHI